MAFLVGCAATEDDTGRIEVPLSSTASDGTVYTMPSGTHLHIGGPRFEDTVPADGSEASLSVTLPVGPYDVTLYHALFPTEDWVLSRTNPDGSVEGVPATLETPMPLAIQILPDETVSITIRFHVPGHGPITFSQGTLDVTTDVVEVDATSARVALGVNANVTSTFSDGPPALETTLPSGPLFIATTFETIGAWEQRSLTKACAPVASLGANATAGFLDLIGLATIGTGELCIHNDAGTHYATYVHTYIGPALELGTNNALIQVYLLAMLPEAVFDGQTLDLALLEGLDDALPLSGYLYLADMNTSSNWYMGSLDGTTSFSFQPRE